MTLTELLTRVAELRIRLSVVEDRLNVQAPKGALTKELTAALTEHKAELLLLLRQDRTEESRELRLDPAGRYDPFPLTDIQRAYFMGRSGGFELSMPCQLVYEIEMRDLDVARLEEAWRHVVERHDMLRAVVNSDGTQQVLRSLPPWSVSEIDLSHCAPDAVEPELERLRHELLSRTLPADRWPLFELRVLRLPAALPRFQCRIELTTLDAKSVQLLLKEWVAHYQNPALRLPPLSLTFRDYVLSEVKSQSGEAWQRSREYWHARLPALGPAPELPTAVAATTLTRPTFRRKAATLAAARLERLRARSQKEGITDAAMLATAWAELLAAWSRTRPFSLNLTLFNRPELHPEIFQIVGDFTSTLLLSVDRWNGSFLERARAMQARLAEDLEHARYSGVRVLRELNRQRGGNLAAAMPIVLTILLGQRANVRIDAISGMRLCWSGSQTPQVWFDHQIYADDTGLVSQWDHIAELFPEPMIDSMMAMWMQRLGQLADEPTAWTEPVPELLQPADRRLIAEVNATACDRPLLPLHEAVWAAVREAPERIAVIQGDTSLTYHVLWTRASALARELCARGLAREELCAILLDRGPDQVVAVLGILLAGGAYLPIAPDLPPARRRALLSAAAVRFAISDKEPGWEGTQAISLAEAMRSQSSELLAPSPQDGQELAYVIYTSGSTGAPKGVMIEHRSASNTIADINARCGIGPGDRVLAVSSLSFDLSVWDILGILSAGGAVVYPEAQRDPAVWLDAILRHRVTVWNSVPALMDLLVETARSRGERLPLRLALLSGDWIPVELPQRIRAIAGPIRLLGLGGATEASIWSVFYEIGAVDPAWSSIPYGRALANQSLTVRDEQLRLRAVGAIGDLYIGGLGLARGYLGDPEKTTERFVIEPRSGERLYRTGDLARLLPDGNLEFLGREDLQVKIRGHRVELGEIEAALRTCPGVEHAVVSAVGEPRGTRRLAAWVVGSPAVTPDPGALRRHLAELLPDYMVPSAIYPLAALPLSDNGKIDRRRLVVPEAALVQQSSRAAPRSDLETALVRLWAEVMEIPLPGIHDNFFGLGGDSLLAGRLLARIRELFGVEVPLRALFKNPTVAELAKQVAASGPAEQAAPKLTPDSAHRFEPFPLTPLQQAYWVGRGAGLMVGNVAGHVYFEIESDTLDLLRLEQAWNKLVLRHDSLRMVISPDGMQRVLPEVPWYRIAEAADPLTVRERMSHQVMPTERWPLFELTATRPAGRVRLHLSLDTLLGDAWAFRVLFRELQELYRNPDAALPERTLRFRDCVLAMERARESERDKQDLAWWRERLSALPPPPELPLRHAATRDARPQFVRRFVRLSADAYLRLTTGAARYSLTPTAVLAAAYAEVVARCCGGAAFTLNVPTFNRPPLHPEVYDVVGDFASFGLLAVDALDERSFAERARMLHERLGEMLDHGAVHGVELVRELGRARADMSRNAFPVVFTSVLSLESIGRLLPDPQELGEQVYSITQTPQVWMDFQVFETQGALTGQLDAVDALFPAGLVDGIAQMLKELLARLSDEPEAWAQPLGDLVPLQQKMRRGPAFILPLSNELPHAAIAAQAMQGPQRTAVIAADRRLSFGELDELAWRLSHTLRLQGIGPDDPVPVVLPKGYRQVVAVLGVLRAGGAYLPVDPAVPAMRLAELLAYGRGPVLTDRQLAAQLSWPAATARILVEDEELAGAANTPFSSPQGPSHLAYVLFTSGSTGRPKGAMVEGQGLTNALRATVTTFAIGPDDRVLGVTALHHDMSVFDVLGVPGAGGTLVLPTTAAARDPAELAKLLLAHRVTIWNSVPAFLELLLEYVEGGHPLHLPDLRLAFIGGDFIPLNLFERLRRVAPRCEFVSVGGPTETTLWNIWHRVDRVEPDWRSIPYGRPIANTEYKIIGPHGYECPDGVPGEMVVTGVGVARGYLGVPTDPRFESAPRSYRTGDLGRFRPDGTIEILGRLDHQLKLLGQRIEPGEVEAALLQHPGLRAAAVGVAQGGRTLVAWVVGDAPKDAELHAFLKSRLPPHMLPARFVHLPALPLSSNGKVDRRALLLSEAAPTPSPAPSSAVKQQLILLVQETLGVQGIGPTSNLLTLGANSIDLVRLGNRIEQQFGVRPSVSELFRDPTIESLAQTLGAGQAADAQDDRAPAALGEKLRSYKLVNDPAERKAFREAQRGIRPRSGAAILPLPGPAFDATLQARYAARRTQRRYALKPVPREAFGRLLACLRQLSEKEGPHYLYPSGGGLYPVQVYVHARPGRVEGVDAGTYYYHPIEHGLVSLHPGVDIARSVHAPFINQPIYDEAAFSLFFICDLDAIGPMYGLDSIHFATLEAGILSQLLDTEAVAAGLGLCHIGRLNFDAIASLFDLGPAHVLIHSMLGGVPQGNVLPEASVPARASRLLERIKQLSPADVQALLGAQRSTGEQS